jgi:tRNA(Ile)-lysidine synthetase-like protein
MPNSRFRSHAGLEQRLLQQIREGPGLPGGLLGVAFSGGTDSLALAIALGRVAPISAVRPHLIHVNHGIRPRSDGDAEQCQNLARELGLELTIVSAEADPRKQAAGVGIEEAARRQRYLALAKSVHSQGSDVIATGHHADDQAETVLLHLFRGSGLSGASGMRTLTDLKVPWWGAGRNKPSQLWRLRVWRPFLTERRETLKAYVRESGLPSVLDESNTDFRLARNYLRLEILPLIERGWPGAVEAIGRFAQVAGRENDFLERQRKDKIDAADKPSTALSVRLLDKMDLAMKRRLVATWLLTNGVEEPNLSAVDRTIQLSKMAGTSAVIEVGSGRSVLRNGSTLMVLCPGVSEVVSGNAEFTGINLEPRVAGNLELLLEFGSPVTVGGWVFLLDHDTLQSIENAFGAKSKRLHVPVGTAVWLRALRAGDRWRDSGRSVRDALRTAGVHPAVRQSVLCVAAKDGVLFIPGLAESVHPAAKAKEYDTVACLRWWEND